MAFPTFDSLPLLTGMGGVRTSYAVILPPGARSVYLRSTGPSQSDPPELQNTTIATTLAQALLQCRSGFGDVIYVLPGHTENVTTTPTFVAGVKIIGVGHGSNRPVFRWTATTSQWAITVADVVISGLRLRLEGANGVVKAIVTTAAETAIESCDIEVASGATNKATIALEFGAGSTRGRVTGCRFRGTATHNVTDGIKIVSAVDGITIENCRMMFSATAANGLIHVTAAATNLTFSDLDLYNTHTASTATITLDDVACDGHATRVYSAMKNDGVATAQGITFGTAALVQCNQCYTVDNGQANGILSPAVET